MHDLKYQSIETESVLDIEKLIFATYLNINTKVYTHTHKYETTSFIA